MYGKRIRDSSTCLGYISWSDDLQSVSYKDVRDLDIEAFRGFIRGQITKAQSLLEELLLMHPDETREHLDTLNLVANRDKADPSPFLWAKVPIPKSTRKSAPENNGQAVYSEVQECWDSARLTRVLTREFQAELGLKSLSPASTYRAADSSVITASRILSLTSSRATLYGRQALSMPVELRRQ
ncbi:uncharacterized protein K489DRAFT_404560 [Dissoconium aciculare CBS 342.82]|uniref:Uncharacterized protein n=1 Tax=Dissoconium aciculare CBS 342.82 TaxID=1314786 RepID=A0A6J3LSN2_9PEZI|nr:uncharacterized protein K489DRAFT_404560 [Dissoconium aciculare CBS 342.82]KAF1818786.1 hypothetical protein K489DRAFT_404560 [Dissoconium aciculare CBS 342.82]